MSRGPLLDYHDEMRPTIPFTDRFTIAVLAASLIAAGCVRDAERERRLDAAFVRVMESEDARPSGGPALDELVEASRDTIPEIRFAAVRALGRLENPELVRYIAPHLADPSSSVRQAAINGLAQSHQAGPGDEALPLLLARVGIEQDAAVRGTLARSLGRLDLSAPNRRLASNEIVELSRVEGRDAPLTTLVGVALGLEALVRGAGAEGLDAGSAGRLVDLARMSVTEPTEERQVSRIRSLALSALGQARRMDRELIEDALDSGEPQAAAVALRYLSSVPPDERLELLDRGLDPELERASPFPAIEALRFIAEQPRTGPMCERLFEHASPEPRTRRSSRDAVRIVAIDALARPCPEVAPQQTLLRSIAEAPRSATSSSGPAAAWQPAAHALVSLARLSPDEARDLVPSFAADPSSFVRGYAARAASAVGDSGALRRLAEDSDPNVRSVALEGLYALEGHAVDDLLLAELSEDDPQLLMTVATLLEGTPRPARVAPALLASFERISAAERETWRDGRRALLARLEGVGDIGYYDRLVPFLEDYDPLVAEDVASVLEAWTGRPHETSPREPPPLALPSASDLRAMDGARVVLLMAGDGEIVVELDASVAPMNAYRFYRLTREGYFDGLTFHRWAPNFVIQGGSPAANEYAGDGPFTRDEVGLLSHWRGTVGISTRGHDTGDGQIFVNLMHNVRLDHTYTIVGEVVQGMDVVDRVLEGAVIERAEVRGGS